MNRQFERGTLIAVAAWLVLALCSPVHAQFNQPARRIVRGASLPATCTIADVFFKTDATVGTYECLTTNSWTAMGGSTSPPGGSDANQPLEGCQVEYVSALIFNIGACKYTIAGVTYNSVLTTKTLGAADATFARVDLIGVDNTGVVFVTPGTPAATPLQPSVAPETQLGLAYVNIPALATTPGNFTATDIYQENVEWAATGTANFNVASTSNPYRGTKDVEATLAVLGNNVVFVKPAAGTENLSTWTSCICYVRSKAAWPTGASGASAARFLNFSWLNGATQVGNAVTVRDGTFGFASTVTANYQQVGIPLGLFTTGSNPVTTLKIAVSGNTGSSTIGFYIDSCTLQRTSGTIEVPSTTGNQNVRTVGATFGSFESGATALTAAATACVPTYFSGTIQAVELIGSPSGSATIDVKTVAHASWTGIGSVASIAAAAIPALSGATRFLNTTLTAWNKTVIADTVFCFVMTAPATLTGAAISLKIQAN